MSIDFLISVLNDMKTAAKINRDKASNIVLEQPQLLKHLVDLTFDTNNKLSIKAAWVLEWICTHHGLSYLYPYINVFASKISTLHFDSSIRPCAKICEHIATAYIVKKEAEIQTILTEESIDLIIETGFDWLITDQKIAVRAYTMTTLYLFGIHKEWIHPELKHLISTKIVHESKGCKARGKHILEMIAKHS